MEEEKSLLEETVPWEVRLLKEFCNSEVDIDSLGYAKKSVLAGSWFICHQASVARGDVCLCGSGQVEESLVRQWVEYYLVRVKRETSWDTLSNDELLVVLKPVSGCNLVMKLFSLLLCTLPIFRACLEWPQNSVHSETVTGRKEILPVHEEEGFFPLQELNKHLAGRVFLVGYRLCLADILLYYGLHRYLKILSFGERSRYIHVSRWFDQVQHFPGVQPFSFPLLVFHRNPDLLL